MIARSMIAALALGLFAGASPSGAFARHDQVATAPQACGMDLCRAANIAMPAPWLRSSSVKRARAALDASGNPVVRTAGLSSLIKTINYKLARYVRPTGKCGASSETLVTYYWQGSRTATGARFNPHGLSAASRTLPFGTHLHLTNPHNGKMVSVVINDRGPYTNAKLDLSLGAAQALGLTQSSYICVADL